MEYALSILLVYQYLHDVHLLIFIIVNIQSTGNSTIKYTRDAIDSSLRFFKIICILIEYKAYDKSWIYI